MSDLLEELTQEYGQALGDYLAGKGESASLRAYWLGRTAIHKGLGLMDVAAAHARAVAAVLAHASSTDESVHLASAAADFFAETLSPFEMAHRGFKEVNVTLRDLNETLQLRNAELDAANKKLEEANRLKSRFLANMSHELRTPLNAIIGFSQMLGLESLGPLQPKQRRYVDHILTSARHLLTLITDLLDLSKIEAGKMELKLEPLGLSELLSEAAVVIRGMADQKQIVIELAIPHKDLTVVADASRLKQIVFNLLSNAIKFTPAGGRVRLTAKAADGFARIAVEDTGIGIAPDDQARLFQEFQQVGTAASQQFAGSGLGLALSRRLAELHGGTMAVESAVGQGSTFTFTLPLTKAGRLAA